MAALFLSLGSSMAGHADGVLVRRQGIAMARLPACLRVWAVDGRWDVELNATAALVFLLCDGTRSATSVAQLLRELFPDGDARVRDEVLEVVSDLRNLGILHGGPLARFEPAAEPRPLLKIAFVDFWSGFNERRNYFLTMLSHLFDPMVVAAGDDDVDVCFFCSANSPEHGPRRLGREGGKAVFVGMNDEVPPGDFDFAFTPGVPADSARGRHFRLPIWAMFADWTAYDEAGLHALHDQRLPDSFHPEAACLRLADALDLRDGQCKAGAPGPRPPSARRPRRRRYRVPRSDARKKLTIGMATHDDYDGVYFTVQALRIYHPECFPDVEIVIVDNDPAGRCGDALRKLVQKVDDCRYVPFFDFSSTCVKDLVFREARAPAVLCVDSHVLIVPGAVKRLMDFFEENPSCNDLLNGPLIDDSLGGAKAQWYPPWHAGVRAQRDVPDPDSEPFEIDVQLNALFACRKDAWPGFSPRFTGYGEEEVYIHEKFRRAGNRVVCLPFLRWMHRFGPRPKGRTYPISWDDRLRNLLLGRRELGLDAEPVKDWFRGILGSPALEDLVADIEDEMSSPFFEFEVPYYVDAAASMTEWDEAQLQLKKLGIYRPRRFADLDPSKTPAASRLLSHRAIVEFAQYAGLESVIVFDRVDGLPAETRAAVGSSLKRIGRTGWGLWALTLMDTGVDGAGCDRPAGDPPVWTHAIAYHRRAFDEILERLDAVASDEPTLEATTIEACLRGVGPVHVCLVQEG